MIRKYYKKPKKGIHNRYFKGIFIIAVGFCFLIVIGLAVKQALSPLIFPLFHGPHLSVALYKAGINEAEVLGSKSRRSNSKSKPSPTPTKRIINFSTPTPILPTSTPALPTPTSTPVPAPTPPTSQVLNQAGIAAGGELTDLSQNELDLYFNQLKELGVSWVRWDFDWGAIQADGSGIYDWTGTDRVVSAALGSRIKTLGIITYTPKWAQQTLCAGTFACAPDDPAAFGKFAGEVANRYAPQGLHHWEIWNEPNIVMFWKPKPDVNSYVAILKSAYDSIKTIDPEAIVLSGGLSPAGDENNNIAPITFIRTLYELDTTKDFDGIAIHPYSYPALASFPASWNCWQQIETIRQLMLAHGDSNKPLWLTEYGAPTSGPGSSHDTTQLYPFTYGSDYMTENAQEMLIRDALLLFSQVKGPTGPFFWYSLHDNGTSRDTPENFFGLLRNDWSKKPAYDVLRNAILSSQ